ncbi:unnamed protein product [Strongylus vulgaris]|uniref:Uncharacterized protein n=1 Tax=Strongylus vulgaris TaxID=40348 RepID=A0A3P7KLC3_STRVU|nr:unnamed protein product [Strongylus vulgaris]
MSFAEASDEKDKQSVLQNVKWAMQDNVLSIYTFVIFRSLLELCHFPPTRRFNPPLPQDQLLSFYISSCRLVCASYHMVPKQSAPQGLSITMAECQLPYLEEVLQQLNLALTHIERLIGNLEMCQPHNLR